MHWKRWYDYVSCAFRAFFEDEKDSRIKGWRRNRCSAQSLLPAVRAVDGGFSAVGCGASCERFQSGWRLSSRKRRCPKEFSGALWPFRRIMGTENVADASHGQRRKSCIFCAAVVNEKDFLTVRKLHRCNQRATATFFLYFLAVFSGFLSILIPFLTSCDPHLPCVPHLSVAFYVVKGNASPE